MINRLQAQCYVTISDFVYMRDRFGQLYGWGVAEYSTPERFMGDDFTSRVYERSPEESYDKILRHFAEILPDADEDDLIRFLK